MTPICVCSVGNDKGLELFLASVRLYVPEPIVYLASPQPIAHFTPFKWIKNEAGNFGDAYNKIMAEAFMDGHETVILANDDVVLDPSTYWLLAHDRVILRQREVLDARGAAGLLDHQIRELGDGELARIAQIYGPGDVICRAHQGQ